MNTQEFERFIETAKRRESENDAYGMLDEGLTLLLWADNVDSIDNKNISEVAAEVDRISSEHMETGELTQKITIAKRAVFGQMVGIAARVLEADQLKTFCRTFSQG